MTAENGLLAACLLQTRTPFDILYKGEVVATYFIYKIIGNEFGRPDEELCGAADTLDNAKLLVSALENIDPTNGHREIRTDSFEVVELEEQKYYLLHLERHELGAVCQRVRVGMADTLVNARRLLKELAKDNYHNWEIRDKDWNIVE